VSEVPLQLNGEMYLFYVDESGNRNPLTKVEEPLVILSLCLHEFQWRRLERNINSRKLRLIQEVHDRTGLEFELADVEVKANTLRMASEREHHRFFKHLSAAELKSLTDIMYDQLEVCHCWLHAVVVDKKCLREYFDTEKLSKKTYELILERGENFINAEHDKQNCIFILDNTSQQLDRSMALKHSYFQRSGTTSGLRLKHIIELPMFVDSRLSNGVQLADLCAYNIFRVFRDEDTNYPYFLRILPFVYKNAKLDPRRLEGIKIFPEDHRWGGFLDSVKNERARLLTQTSPN
jgi:hypothetical protein